MPLCTYVCVCDTEREKVRERIFPCVSAAVVWLFCDSHRQSTGNAPRCGQSQLNFFSDKDRFFFFLRSLTVHPYSAIMHFVRFDQQSRIKQKIVCFLCVCCLIIVFFHVHFLFLLLLFKQNICQAWPLTCTHKRRGKNEGWRKVTGKQIQCHILLLSSLCHLAF